MKKLVTIIMTAFIIFSVSGIQAGAETIITPSISFPGDEFGNSVDMADNVAIVGTLTNENGAAFVYENDNNGWVEKAILTASDNASGFGSKVAISQSFAVAANYGENVYMFQKPESGWQDMTETNKIQLYQPGYEAIAINDLSIHGNTLAVCYSANYQNEIIRPVLIYNYTGNNWILTDTISSENYGIHGENYERCEGNYGSRIDVFDDFLIIGSEKCGALVYKKENGKWVFNAKLITNVTEATKFFGRDVAISEDIAIVGDNGTRSAYIFKYDGDTDTWVNNKKPKKLNESEDALYYGLSVDITKEFAVVGSLAFRTNELGPCGAAFLYKLKKLNKEDEVYEKVNKYIAPTPQFFGRYGWSVALSENHLLVGNPGDQIDGFDGSAVIYDLFVPGDLDKDGDIDKEDLAILRLYLNQPASDFPSADLNNDGVINILDARKIIISCSYPGCECR
ncbi:dockerin type I domain-containing protein [Desulfobacterales bacterium HSG17]|nr:dockerin type I domain-containing protein [Desulfobacterales bacterium HSG17]